MFYVVQCLGEQNICDHMCVSSLHWFEDARPSAVTQKVRKKVWGFLLTSRLSLVQMSGKMSALRGFMESDHHLCSENSVWEMQSGKVHISVQTYRGAEKGLTASHLQRRAFQVNYVEMNFSQLLITHIRGANHCLSFPQIAFISPFFHFWSD